MKSVSSREFFYTTATHLRIKTVLLDAIVQHYERQTAMPKCFDRRSSLS